MKYVGVVAVVSLIFNIVQGVCSIRLNDKIQGLKTYKTAAEERERLFDSRINKIETYTGKARKLVDELEEEISSGPLREDVARRIGQAAINLQDEREQVISTILADQQAYLKNFDNVPFVPSTKESLGLQLKSDPLFRVATCIQDHYKGFRREGQDQQIRRLAAFARQLDPRETALRVTAPEGVNVRAGPSTAATKVKAIKGGTEVVFLSIQPSGSWVMIELPNGKRGWIYVEYLSEVESILGQGGIWLL